MPEHRTPRHAAPRPARLRRRVTALALAGVAATAAGVLSPSSSVAAAANGSTTVTVGSRSVDVTFNTPGNDAQWDQAARLIRQSSPGSTIRMGIYNLTTPVILDAVKAAVRNDVNVYAVGNGEHHTDGESPRLVELSRLLGSRFRWCDADRTSSNDNDACISNSSSGYMHAKYMMFSETKGRAGAVRKNVVWVSSANFSGSGKDLYNNSVTVYEDATLYRGFLSDVWTPMWTDPGYADNDYYNVGAERGYFGSSASNSTVYVSPEQTTDLWLNRLNYVNPSNSCRIRVMHNTFRDTRLDVAKKLRSLASGGCVIRVITAKSGTPMGSQVKSTLNHPNISLRTSPVHDKTILVNARYDGSAANRYIVFTGSQNLTLDALRYNDEILLKLGDSKPLHDAFVDHFQHAWANGSDAGGGSSS